MTIPELVDVPTNEFARVGHCLDDDVDLYIGRHGDDGERHLLNTPIGEAGWLGNPYPLSTFDRGESVANYCRVLIARIEQEPAFARALALEVHGRDLGCWCRRLDEDEPLCHGDVIADAAAMCTANGRDER